MLFAVILLLCGLLLLWYLYPLLTLDVTEPSVPIELDVMQRTSSPQTPFGLKRLALGWFNGRKPMEKSVRVLILGFDDNGGGKKGRTDVIMVGEMDPEKGIGIISVPRDLWVPVPDELVVKGRRIVAERRPVDSEVRIDSDTAGGEIADTDTKGAIGPLSETFDSSTEPAESAALSQKDSREFNRINAIYRLGNRYFGKGMGHLALKKVLREELNLKVDYTVAIDYEGVRQVIDAIGGVSVDVECPVQDNFVSHESPTGYQPLNVPAGRQTLSGKEALLFMRSRHGRTDMDRSRRQQKVLMALRKQVLSESNFFRLPALLSRMLRFIKTDADSDAILQMAVTAKRLRGGLHGMVLRPPMISRMKTDDGKSVVVLNAEKYNEKRKQLFSAQLPGIRDKGICPRADVALHWRKLKKEDKTATILSP